MNKRSLASITGRLGGRLNVGGPGKEFEGLDQLDIRRPEGLQGRPFGGEDPGIARRQGLVEEAGDPPDRVAEGQGSKGQEGQAVLAGDREPLGPAQGAHPFRRVKTVPTVIHYHCHDRCR